MSADLEEEISKEMVLKCLKLSKELEELEKTLCVKRKSNFQLRRYNKRLTGKFKLLKGKRFKDDQYQELVKMNNCSVEMVDVERRQEEEEKKTRSLKKVGYLIKNSQFVCQYPGCGRKFNSKYALNKHQNTHSSKFQCQFCSKCFESSATLQIHLRTHTNERPFVCDWVGCGKRFKIRGEVKKHINHVHNANRSIQCQHAGCLKTFKTKRCLLQHLKNVHVKMSINICEFICQHAGCLKRFKTRHYLAQHSRNFHCQIKREFRCDVGNCQKTFTFKSGLNYHRETHLPRSLQCKFTGCSKAFGNERALKMHAIHCHSNSRFPCDFPGCPKIYNQKTNLSTHKKTHL